jgi:hypothetical protein
LGEKKVEGDTQDLNPFENGGINKAENNSKDLGNPISPGELGKKVL